MKAALIIIALAALLVGAVIGVVHVWREADVSIEPIGWWAIGLGGGFSVLIGAGLMALVFYSARRGFDERAARPDEHDS